MAKIPPEQKSAKMAEIGLTWAVIQAEKTKVHALEVQAAPQVAEIHKSFGPGPHKMSVPTPVLDDKGQPVPGQSGTKDMIVTLRKDGDRWAISAVDANSIT